MWRWESVGINKLTQHKTKVLGVGFNYSKRCRQLKGLHEFSLLAVTASSSSKMFCSYSFLWREVCVAVVVVVVVIFCWFEINFARNQQGQSYQAQELRNHCRLEFYIAGTMPNQSKSKWRANELTLLANANHDVVNLARKMEKFSVEYFVWRIFPSHTHSRSTAQPTTLLRSRTSARKPFQKL